MKNLKVLFHLKHSIGALANSQNFTIATFDYNSNIFKRNVFIFVCKAGDIFKVNPVDGNYSLLVSIKQLFDDNDCIVSLFYNTVLNSLNLALRSGDVLSITLNEDLSCNDNDVQCVGSISAGVQKVSMSPDSETIVFLTGDNKLILMSGNFDPIDETDLLGSDQGDLEMVNVGWGKKETQFHGTEGKEAAKRKVTNEEIGSQITGEQTKETNISWRGDSTLFAVIYWCPDKNHQQVKIFDKAGRLQCTSEFLPGLEWVLSWRPSGNLIALAQKLPNKHVICFMEKNGLRHGEFTLPQNIKVLDLLWNSESTILSAVCEDESVGRPCVLLWTTGNYHWYLKQRLDLSCAVVGLRWDDVIGNLAHILLNDGSYLAYQWIWNVDHSFGITDNDLAVVAVVDGCDVKLTAFKKCIIPPPMCAATVSLPCSVLQVMFAPFCDSLKRGSGLCPNDLCLYLSDGRLARIKGMEATPQLNGLMSLEWKCLEENLLASSPISITHWLWISDNKLIFVICSDGFYLCLVDVNGEEASVVSASPLKEPVLTVTHSGNGGALVQLRDGKLLFYRDGNLAPHTLLTALPQPCMAVSCVGTHIFSRAHNSHMFVDGELISTDVTSFFCLPQLLVMTLSNHQLFVTSSDTSFKIKNENEGSTNRRLERGSMLVTVTGHSVVLQLPRGNLETVEPRALTLVTAAQLLDAGDYKTVAQLLRRQRIDLNLCVDHNPSAFLLAVPRLVAQVRDPQWLSVFLAELAERDVTRGMYAGYYNSHSGRGPPLANKVERVCTALREAMTQTEADRQLFLQPILSTFVRTGRVGEAISMADTDQALGYLTLLMDTDRLYEEALGVYNLEKALKIAGKSLKDPKEYVAYLNNLREMEPAYMRFTIDKRQRKPQSALRNLALCAGRAADCLQYVQETGLYSLALELFREQPDLYRRVCLLYGADLQQKQCYQEAGLMFSRGGDITRAMAAFTRAGCWQQCLTLATQNGYSEIELAELHESLYSALQGSQEYREAAQLSSQLAWHERAITCYLDAHCWAHAIYHCHAHQLDHLIESTVKPALLESQGRLLADLRAKKEDLDKYSARLLIVREKKTNRDYNFDTMSDIQSDTSSLSSFSTSSGGSRTTRNTRKAQRKLWSLKEGNPREEQALLYTITELVQSTERLTGSVRDTCLALGELGLDAEASRLHVAMTTALQHTENIRQTVWPLSAAVRKTGSDAEAVDPTAIDSQLSFPPALCVSSMWKLHIYSSTF